MENLRRSKRSRWTRWPLFLAATVLTLTVAGFAFLSGTRAPAPALNLSPAPAEASTGQVHQFCGACHAYPPPDTFPRSAWRREVRQGYDLFARFPIPGMA